MLQTETQPWLEFYAWNTDGSPKNDLVFNTTGITLLYQRDNLADSAALTLSAASGPTDWAAGKFLARGGNKYRVGIPAAAISSFTGKASLAGSYTGGVLVGTTEAVLPPVPTATEISADVSDQISQDFVAGVYSWGNVLIGIGNQCQQEIENGAIPTSIAALPTATEVSEQISDDFVAEKYDWLTVKTEIAEATRIEVETGTGVPLKDNGITATKIAAAALNGKGNWNIGKTGYALTSTEKTSIASSVWASTTRVLTAFGFTVATDGASRTASQANVSSLATTAQLTAAQASIEGSCVTADVFGLLTTSDFNNALPTNFSDLDVEVTTGKVTTANPAAGSGSSHTASDVAALILETPANKLATDGSGRVTTENTPDLSAITAELAKMPRATSAIAAGAFVMTITGGQDAEVTYSEPV